MATDTGRLSDGGEPTGDWSTSWDWLDGDEAERAAAEETLRDNLKNRCVVGDLSHRLDIPANPASTNQGRLDTLWQTVKKWWETVRRIEKGLPWPFGVSDHPPGPKHP